MRRRRYLAAVGLGALAGCLDSSNDTNGDEQTENGDETTENGEEGVGDETDDSGTDESAEAELFERRWQERLDAGTLQSVEYAAAATESELVIGHSSGLTAFTTDGRQLWDRDDPQAYRDIHADENGVVALTSSKEIIEFDSESGETVWSATVEGVPEVQIPNAALTSESALVGAGGRGLWRYDRASGEGGKLSGAPGGTVLGGDGVAVVVGAFELVGIDPVSGDQRWSRDISSSRSGALTDGTVAVVDASSRDESALAAVDAQTGTVEFERSVDPISAIAPDLTVTGGVVGFVDGGVSGEQTLRVHNLADGTRRWEVPLGDVTSPFAPVGTDEVLVGRKGDNLAAFDIETGEQLASTPAGFLIGAALVADGAFFECWDTVTAYEL